MFRSKTVQDPQATLRPPAPSSALEWLWQNLRDVKRPYVLDCGPVCQATLNVLLKRGVKLYVADLVTPVGQADSRFFRQAGRKTVFSTDEFLAELPPIPSASLSAIVCWHLLDLVPHDVLPDLMAKLWSLVRPGGALFCLLREPALDHGAGTRWWFNSLVALGSEPESKILFPYPVISNREIERLVPGGNVKTFLTRAARREVLAMK